MIASPFKPGDKVVAYCRYSEGVEQGQRDTSTEEQADAIRRFCDESGLELVRVFADPFASGRSVAKRDHYLEMLSFLLHKKRKPDVQGVVLWDFERYGRNYDQAQLDAARLRMAGYKLFSLQQPIMDSGPFSHVLEAMYFASAQNQSDMISADVKRALQNRFQKYKTIPRSSIGFGFRPEPVNMGSFTDGTPRIGYRAVPDPEQADLIRRAVDARIHGASMSECREIMGVGENVTVKRLFANPLLIGRMSYGDTVMDDYCDPILTQETWDVLQAYNASHQRKQVGRQGGWSADPPMLSGLLYCAHCGVPMYINRRRSKGHLYCTYRCKQKCTPGIRQEIIEPFIIGLCEKILTPENVRRWVSDLISAPRDDAEMIAAYEREMADVERKISNLADLIADHPSEALMLKLAELESRRDSLRQTLRFDSGEAETCINADTLYNSTIELINALLRILRSPDESPENKKTALSTFVRSIVVDYDGKVVINYCPPGLVVVTQSPQITKAPPEGVYSESQRIM